MRGKQTHPIRVDDAIYCSDPVLNQVGLNPLFTIIKSYMTKANLMPENGLDGGGPRGTNKGRPCSEQARKNLDNGRRNRVYTSMSAESKEKLRNSKLGKQSTHETREKLKLARARHLASDKIRYEITDPLGSMYIYNRLEIKQCCIVNDLTYASLLAKGKQGKLYKGWKATLIKS
jgi:hypothetical protein